MLPSSASDRWGSWCGVAFTPNGTVPASGGVSAEGWNERVTSAVPLGNRLTWAGERVAQLLAAPSSSRRKFSTMDAGL